MVLLSVKVGLHLEDRLGVVVEVGAAVGPGHAGRGQEQRNRGGKNKTEVHDD